MDQSSELEAQQQENEELRKQIEEQEAEQEEAEDRAAAEEQEEMQQRIDELERQAEENESQGSDQPQPSEPSDVAMESNEDWTAPPSQATEGIVVVSDDFDVQAVTAEEAQAIDAAIAYYQAVEIGDYYTTHSLLSTDDQNLFPLDSWVAANTSLDSAAGEFVVTSAYPDDVGNGYPTYAMTVMVYLTDGSSFARTTYFTNEGNGYWAHWLSQEEMDLFNSAL